MKVLLIEPAKSPLSIGGEDLFLYESLALEYVAAGVAQEHDVRILDMRLNKDLQSTLEVFKPDIVGITSYTVHVNAVRKITKLIKKWDPRILVVVGGHHATVAPEDFVSPVIDLIVMGEGVFAFQEIVERFQKGKDFSNIPGVAYARGEKLIITSSPVEIGLDAMPLPERKLTAKYRKHYYSEWMKPLASVRTSKGCPHRCNFCALWKISKGRYLTRNPEKIVEELETIDEKYVFFADDESLLDVDRMTELARLIKYAGIKKRYYLYGRSDTIARNPGLLAKWREVGLEKVFIGLEFFKVKDLEFVRKSSTLDDNRQAIRILHDLGIDEHASLIVRPEFTTADFRAFRQYCRDLGLRYAGFAVLTPLPGTDLYEDTKSRIMARNYDYFDFIHTVLPTALPLQDFYREYYLLQRKAVAIDKQISFLKRYPRKEIPSTLLKAFKIYRRIKRAYLDYDK
jgi:radical SAM superfamily enzyme YgiQ (UPF0313 family)